MPRPSAPPLSDFLNKIPLWPLPVLVILVTVLRFALVLALHHPIPYAESYNFYLLHSNYYTDGFVRRGLTGTIAQTLGALRNPASLIFVETFFALWIAVPLLILVRRLRMVDRTTSLIFAFILLASPQLFLAWSGDVGRADVLAGGFIAWAMLFTLDRRFFLAAAFLAIGSLAHENTIIFGAPLCVTFGALNTRGERAPLGRGVAALGLLIVGLIAIAVGEHVFGASSRHIAASIIQGDFTNGPAVYAAYSSVSGLRGLVSSACMSFNPAALGIFYIVNCFAVLALYGYVLFSRTRTDLLVILATSVLPLIVISVLAIDYGRWLSLAVLSAWLAAVGLRLQPGGEARPLGGYRPRLVVFGVILVMGIGDMYNASWVTARLAKSFWPHVSRDNGKMDRCDPTWRSVVGAPSSP